jgi:hypothetical protein
MKERGFIKERSFIEEIEIDKFSLDKECATNGEKVIYWGSKWAEANALREEAKKRLDEVRANLDLSIRENPESFGVVTKLTETMIEQLIKRHSEYKKAYEDYISAKRVAEELNMVKEAFLQRKDLLLAEIRLFLADYYHSEETLSLETEEDMEERIKMRRKAVKGKGRRGE